MPHSHLSGVLANKVGAERVTDSNKWSFDPAIRDRGHQQTGSHSNKIEC